MQETQIVLRDKAPGYGIDTIVAIKNENEMYNAWATDLYSYIAVYAIFDAANNGKFELFEYVFLPYIFGFGTYYFLYRRISQLNLIASICAVATALWALWEHETEAQKKNMCDNSINTLFLFDSVIFILSLRMFLCAIRAFSRAADIATLLKSVVGNVIVLCVLFFATFFLHSVVKFEVATSVAPYLFVAALLSVISTVAASNHSPIETAIAGFLGCTVGVIATAIFDVHSPGDIKSKLNGFPHSLFGQGPMSNLLYAILRYAPYVFGFFFILNAYRGNRVCNPMLTIESGQHYYAKMEDYYAKMKEIAAHKMPHKSEGSTVQ